MIRYKIMNSCYIRHYSPEKSIEIYKVKSDLNLNLMEVSLIVKKILFRLKGNCNLSVQIPRTSSCCIEAAKVRWTRTLLLSLEIKGSQTFIELKPKIKKHRFNTCNCLLYRIFVSSNEFIYFHLVAK